MPDGRPRRIGEEDGGAELLRLGACRSNRQRFEKALTKLARAIETVGLAGSASAPATRRGGQEVSTAAEN